MRTPNHVFEQTSIWTRAIARAVALPGLLCVLLAASLSAQLAPNLDPSDVPYRPDRTWLFGNQQTTYNTIDFGMSSLTFGGDGPIVSENYDSVSAFRFKWNNCTYMLPGGRLLLGNGFALVRDLTDTLADHGRFMGPKWQEYQPFGQSQVLPLKNNMLAWVSEVHFDAPFPRIFAPRAFAVTYLDGARLTTMQQFDSTTIIGETRLHVLPDTFLNETFDHVPDGNGGWWGVVLSAESNRFNRYRITQDSFTLLAPVSAGPRQTHPSQNITRLKFRPGGDAFAIVGADSSLGLYRFDRRTADITLWASVPVHIAESWWQPYRFRHDAEWSACGRYLFIAYQSGIMRVDTEAPDLSSAAAWTAVVDTVGDPYPVSYFDMELGPDCRIYIGVVGSGTSLSVIDEPSTSDALISRSLKKDALELGRYYFVSIPDHPDYAQWARDEWAQGRPTSIDTATCDARLPSYPYRPFGGTVAVEEPVFAPAASAATGLRAYPNPAQAGGQLYLRFALNSDGTRSVAALQANGPVTAWITDGLGRQQSLGVWGGEAEPLLLPTVLPKGGYVVELLGGAGQVARVAVVVR